LQGFLESASPCRHGFQLKGANPIASQKAKNKVKKTFPQKNIYPLQYSHTKVNSGFGVWGNRRVVVGIRVDEKLYEAFKPVAKQVFGSVCRPIEAFMASIIATAQTEVNFGQTIEIKEIRIERNLRARRALVVDKPDQCGFRGCKQLAVGSGVWRGEKEYQLCQKHSAEAKVNSDWKVLAHG